MRSKVYEIPNKLIIEWDSEANVMVATWLTYMVTFEEYKKAIYNNGLEIVKRHKAIGWIVDSSKAKGAFSTEIQNFIKDVVFPADVKLGVKYFITIDSESAITNLNVNRYSVSADSNGIKVIKTDSVEAALDWLKQDQFGSKLSRQRTKVFENPGKVLLEWDFISNVMIATWDTYYISLAEYTEAIQEGLKMVKQHGIKAWIVDSSNAKGVFSKEIQDYIRDVVFPTDAGLGVKYFITIDSVSALTNINVRLYSVSADSNGIKSVKAHSVHGALEWLKQEQSSSVA